MNKTLIAFFILLFCMLSSLGWSSKYDDVKKGETAILKKDFATALNELKPLAENGNDEAQWMLGNMYSKGNGVIKDIIYAHMWWNISASLGNGVAEYNRDLYEKRMSARDISTAQKLARQCVEKKYKGC